MNTLLIRDNWKRLVIVISLGLVARSTTASPASEFEQLLANPSRFDGKRVTLIGVADVGGAEFFLSIDAKAAKTGSLDKSVFVVRDLKGPLFENLDKHWVELTGIVNAKSHGPLGGLPCEVVLERIRRVQRPSIPDTNVYGVFRNDTGSTLRLHVPAPTGYSAFDIAPHSTGPPGVISAGTVEVTTSAGKLIVKGDIAPSEKYFDSANRTYYYRIVRGKIDPVMPGETKSWDIYRTN